MAASAPLAAQIAARKRAIFAACKAAGLDDDARRAVIYQVTGRHRSLTDCTLADLNAVLDHLNRGQQGYQGRKRVTPAPERAALLGKVDAMLAELHRVTGQVHTLRYADAIAKRNGWAECVDFADEKALRNIVGALNRTLQFKKAGN
ncbi:phage protein GemA/Gp16 family protein [Pseudothauera rhizosphaerae]|uniref:DUF1018 domain-containing protein n=1 Tax=Pseudothauera rhizosphaerae TaxID=2565932 RepID=A0A4S4AMV1_9RHOO|nr:phage protein GemA/Gp16 family protein [Pseudothauera rhizosphaerae]THF60930.1 DUF1018 domain-containing protein [Pseudothauera rhizosphaerae]